MAYINAEFWFNVNSLESVTSYEIICHDTALCFLRGVNPEFSLRPKKFEWSLNLTHFKQNTHPFVLKMLIEQTWNQWWTSLRWRYPEAPEAVDEKYSSLACLRTEKNGLRTHCVDAEKYKGTFQVWFMLPTHIHEIAVVQWNLKCLIFEKWKWEQNGFKTSWMM